MCHWMELWTFMVVKAWRQFPTIVYLTKENWSMYGSQIETKKMFSILGILINVNLV